MSIIVLCPLQDGVLMSTKSYCSNLRRAGVLTKGTALFHYYFCWCTDGRKASLSAPRKVKCRQLDRQQLPKGDDGFDYDYIRRRRVSCCDMFRTATLTPAHALNYFWRN